MKTKIVLRIASLAIAALAPLTSLSDSDCPGCDCGHFPISDPSCAKCCFAQKGTVTSVSSTTVTLAPILKEGEQLAKTFEIQKSTNINGQLKEGTSATIYYHTANGRNIATRIDGFGFSHGSLVPANLPSPHDICAEMAERLRMQGHPVPRVPADAMRIFFGNSEAYSTEQRFIVFRIDGEEMLVLQKTETGMSVSAKIRSPNGQLIAQIVDNEFFINPHNSFQIKGGSTSSLVVYSNQGERILDVEFVNPTAIKILGTFFGTRGTKIIISEDRSVFVSGTVTFDMSGNCLAAVGGVIDMNAK
jgi:hypothetical protein